MKTIYTMLLSVALFFSGATLAEVTHPQQLLEQVTGQVLAALRELNHEDSGRAGLVSEKIQQLILPHMDFRAMSKKVLGKHWRNASEDQRTAFVQQFKRLLIRTYETSLSKYREEKVRFLPFRAGKRPDKLAVVKSEIIRSNGPTIPINYSLLKRLDADWKVYDIGIEGISLVTNYRSSFSREIERKGIDALIQSLSERNQASVRAESS